ncbi:MAG: hypothetical protein GY696_16365 [Gammaproteobacteria bacterium]|nr:hypothetical protein [Gammaproteobacteria bacterium]
MAQPTVVRNQQPMGQTIMSSSPSSVTQNIGAVQVYKQRNPHDWQLQSWADVSILTESYQFRRRTTLHNPEPSRIRQLAAGLGGRIYPGGRSY